MIESPQLAGYSHTVMLLFHGHRRNSRMYPDPQWKLVAGSFASAEGIWLIRLGNDFMHTFTPIPIFTDNQSFIMFANNDVNNNRTTHIDTHYHYTRNEIANGNIKLHYIPTHDNSADILMKPLSPRNHKHLLDSLDIRCA
jgi:hypothetical protein